MISIRSVRFNLTLWYLAVLASGMILFGTGTWLMLRHTLLTNGGANWNGSFLPWNSSLAKNRAATIFRR